MELADPGLGREILQGQRIGDVRTHVLDHAREPLVGDHAGEPLLPEPCPSAVDAQEVHREPVDGGFGVNLGLTSGHAPQQGGRGLRDQGVLEGERRQGLVVPSVAGAPAVLGRVAEHLLRDVQVHLLERFRSLSGPSAKPVGLAGLRHADRADAVGGVTPGAGLERREVLLALEHDDDRLVGGRNGLEGLTVGLDPVMLDQGRGPAARDAAGHDRGGQRPAAPEARRREAEGLVGRGHRRGFPPEVGRNASVTAKIKVDRAVLRDPPAKSPVPAPCRGSGGVIGHPMTSAAGPPTCSRH